MQYTALLLPRSKSCQTRPPQEVVCPSYEIAQWRERPREFRVPGHGTGNAGAGVWRAGLQRSWPAGAVTKAHAYWVLAKTSQEAITAPTALGQGNNSEPEVHRSCAFMFCAVVSVNLSVPQFKPQG
jgi:hypothetical protein